MAGCSHSYWSIWILHFLHLVAGGEDLVSPATASLPVTMDSRAGKLGMAE